MTIRKTSFRGTIYTLLAYGCVPVAFILQLACMKQSISIKETFNVKKKKPSNITMFLFVLLRNNFMETLSI